MTLLDQAIAFGAGKLETSQVKELLGTIDDVYLFELVEHILAGNGEGAHHSLQRILELQVDYQKVIEALIDLMHQLTITQQLGSEDEDLHRLANSVDGELLQLLYQIAINALEKFSVHPSPYQAVEMCVLRMLTFHPLNEFKPQINEKKNSKSKIKADVSETPKKKAKEEVAAQQLDKEIKVPATNGRAASEESLSISDWPKDFEKLDLNGISYQLFSELEFKEVIGNKLVLVKPKKFASPTSALLEEFGDKCKEYFKIRPEVVIEEGNVINSPSLLKEKIAIKIYSPPLKSWKISQLFQRFLNHLMAQLNLIPLALKMKRDLLFDLIEALTILPGVGKKSAQRMALYLLDKNKDGAAYLGDTLKEALENVQRCKQCRILTSDEYCRICSDSSRDQSSLCIVESPSDVLAIESTGGFKGRYFVLMGRLSPIDGITPEDLGIPDLLQYIKTDRIEEVILATSSTFEGDSKA